MVKKLRSNPVDRRRFIFETVQREKEVTLKVIQARFPGVKRQSVHDDVTFLNQVGVDIATQRRGRETVFINMGSQSLVSKTEHAKRNAVAKEAIANLAVSIILGTDASLPTTAVASSSIYQRTIDRCHQPARQYWNNDLRYKFREFWNESTRMIALDAGSTNDGIANLLKNIDIPNSESRLDVLEACTNSRDIFNTLGERIIPVRTIMVGGHQIRTTSAVAGFLAELFLKSAASLTFGISFIGATMVNMRDLKFIAPHHEEVGVKSLFLNKSSIRIIVADASKFTQNPSKVGYNFTSISNKHVDLIITSHPELSDFIPNEPSELTSRKTHAENFSRFVQIVEERGIPVLIAPLEKHFARNENFPS